MFSFLLPSFFSLLPGHHQQKKPLLCENPISASSFFPPFFLYWGVTHILLFSFVTFDILNVI